MKNGITLLMWLLVATGCYSLSERPGGPLSIPTYREMMALARAKYVAAPEELAQCPKFNGVFEIKNSAQNKGGRYLIGFLRAVGLKYPATLYPGGRPEDPPVPERAPVLDLFSHTPEGLVIRSSYVYEYDLTTIELRPLGDARFRARITHREGRVAEGTVEFELYRNPNTSSAPEDKIFCENGEVKSVWFSKTGSLLWGWRLYEEPETGDILVVNTTPKWAGEIASRFKRVGR